MSNARRVGCAAVALAASLPAWAAGSDAQAAPSVEFGARLQLDHDRFRGLYSAGGGSEHETYLRRATLDLSGRLHRHWKYALDLQLDDGGDHRWRVAALTWTGLRATELSVGRMKPDFGLEQATSSKWTTGIERSAIWDLAPDANERSNGIAVQHAGAWTHASLGGWRRAAGHNALVARAVAAPALRDGTTLHVGVSHAAERIARSDGRIRSRLGVQGVSETPDGHRSTLAPALAGEPFDRDRSWLAELALARGPFSIQSEVLQRRLGGVGTRTARGGYVQLAWTLTGESRPYTIDGARFQAIKPANAQRGAWELFFRHDALRVDGVPAARAQVEVLGVNWYVNPHLKLSANLLHARTDRPDNDVASRDGDAISLRVQWVL